MNTEETRAALLSTGLERAFTGLLGEPAADNKRFTSASTSFGRNGALSCRRMGSSMACPSTLLPMSLRPNSDCPLLANVTVRAKRTGIVYFTNPMLKTKGEANRYCISGDSGSKVLIRHVCVQTTMCCVLYILHEKVENSVCRMVYNVVAPVAQWSEHVPAKNKVASSSLAGRTPIPVTP